MGETISINIDDFISDDEKRSIAREAFRAACQAKAAQDFERILSNAAYTLVAREVDAAFDGDMVAVVRDKAISVIKSMGTHTVFRPANAWERDESKGWKHLQAALDTHRPLIEQRVAEIIGSLDGDEIRSILSDRIADAILDRVAGSRAAATARHTEGA